MCSDQKLRLIASREIGVPRDSERPLQPRWRSTNVIRDHPLIQLHNDVVNPQESPSEGQGDENTHAVSPRMHTRGSADSGRGLDNAGKTTIVKRIMQEDVSTVSPTLGFIIKTIDYQG